MGKINNTLTVLRDEKLTVFSDNIKIDPAIEALPLGPKTRKEVAREYDVTLKTLRCRLRKAKIDVPGGIIFPKTLKNIYNALGLPKNLVT